MRLILFLVCILIGQLTYAANAQTSRNLAYDDKFVWYLAGRLASNLTEFQAKAGVSLNEGEWVEQRTQFEILYHHYLVECSGPLPKIAEILRFFDVSVSSDAEGTRGLAYVGSMDYKIWPVIREWHGKILVPLMNTYATGRYGFFPECVVQGFKEQNPIPDAGSK